MSDRCRCHTRLTSRDPRQAREELKQKRGGIVPAPLSLRHVYQLDQYHQRQPDDYNADN